MKVVFFGTPNYVIPVLKVLHTRFNKPPEKNLIGIVTQPPKIVGRQKFKEFSAVDNYAHKRKINIIYDPNDLPEADLGVLAAYGEIIPQKVINRFRYGILNVHPSLLPEFRGASPTQASITLDKKTTGVSIIKMDELLDHGPIVSSFKDELHPDDTNESLRQRLFERASDFLTGMIDSYVSGKIKLKPQDHNNAIYTRQINKEDGFISPELFKLALLGKKTDLTFNNFFIKNVEFVANAKNIERLSRAFYPWPGIWTLVKTNKNVNEPKRLKIIKCRLVENKLMPELVQLEGKTEVNWKQFQEGYPEYEF